MISPRSEISRLNRLYWMVVKKGSLEELGKANLIINGAANRIARISSPNEPRKAKHGNVSGNTRQGEDESEPRRV